MGVKAIQWAFNLAPHCRSAEQQMILMVLADCHNDDTGKCFPTREYIARKINQTERNITRALNFFEDRGWIRRTPGKGRGNPTEIELALQGDFPTEMEDEEAEIKGEKVKRRKGEKVTAEAGIDSNEKGEKVTEKTGKGDRENGEKVTAEAFPPHPPIMSNQKINQKEPFTRTDAREGQNQQDFTGLSDVQVLEALGLVTVKRLTRHDTFRLNNEMEEMRALGIAFQQVPAFLQWWNVNDWRGKQGQKPTLKQIRQEWDAYLTAKTAPPAIAPSVPPATPKSFHQQAYDTIFNFASRMSRTIEQARQDGVDDPSTDRGVATLLNPAT